MSRGKVAVEDRAMTAKQIEAAAIKLPKQERERLAQKLLDTLPVRPENEDPEILAAWIKEAERRGNELESGKVKGIPAEVVFQRLRKSGRR
jgi:putative addiction module component (TIGR02574 family)